MSLIHPFKTCLNRSGLLAALLLVLGLHSLCAEITVSAEFSPAEVALGDRTQYRIIIQEQSTRERPQPGRIAELSIVLDEGLELRNGRTSASQQTTITNGKAVYSSSLQLILDAMPSAVGSYTIPGFELSYKEQQLQVPASTLTVLERPANATPPTQELIQLKADIPPQLYLGETRNIQLKLYIYEGVNYRGYDQFERSADGFTVSDLTEPTVSAEMIEGHRYRVVSWPMTITPIQAGPQPLNFALSVVAELPAQPQTRNQHFGGNSPFGNSFFNGLFAQTQRFDLSTTPMQVEVKALPAAGQPAGFSGAVGNFNLQVYADTDRVEQGEPLTLSAQISGTGNFPRINGPELPTTPNWRSYPPDAVMQTAGPDDLRGIKRFDYIMIPQHAGQLELPGVNFSYFDPETESYLELQTPPIPVEVTVSTAKPAAQTASDRKPQDHPAEPTATELEPLPQTTWLQLEPRSHPGRSPGLDTLNQPFFYSFNTLALLTLGFTARRLYTRRKLQLDADYALRQSAGHALRQARKACRAAVKTGDASAFYRDAQNAVRCALTQKTGCDLRTAELNTIESVLQQLKTSDAYRQAISKLFEDANTLRFSSQSTQSIATDLGIAQQELTRILKIR
jgi:hypothetical protein